MIIFNPKNLLNYLVLCLFIIISMNLTSSSAEIVEHIEIDSTDLVFETSYYNSYGVLYANQGTEYGNGSIWRSFDNGDSWKCIWSFPYNPPKNGRVCFVDSRNYIHVCGLYGTLWRSIDNGTTFHQTLTPVEGHKGEMWNMDEDNQGNLYVATHGNVPKVYKSSDEGASWIEVSGLWGEGTDINGLTVNPWNNWIYVTRGYDSSRIHQGVWRSMDEGTTWEHISYNSEYRLALSCLSNYTILVSNEKSSSKGLISEFKDIGNSTVSIETKYEIKHYYSKRPATWLEVYYFTDNYSSPQIWFGTASTGSLDQHDSIVARSIDFGKTWEIITTEPTLSPRSEFYYTTIHPERATDEKRYFIGYLFPSSDVMNLRVLVNISKPRWLWDRIIINSLGVDDSNVYLGEIITVWFRGNYEYDELPIDSESCEIYLNNQKAEWNPSLSRWEVSFFSNNETFLDLEVTSFNEYYYSLREIEFDVDNTRIYWKKRNYVPIALVIISLLLVLIVYLLRKFNLL